MQIAGNVGSIRNTSSASHGWRTDAYSPTVSLGFLASFLGLLITALGCHLPDPVNVRTEVVTNGIPNKESSPFLQMPLEPGQVCPTRIAVIDIDGLIVNENQTGLMSAGTNPVSEFRARLDYIACHPQIRAVVLRINSPGGGVTASDIMHCELKKFKATTGLPVVACMMDVGTGGRITWPPEPTKFTRIPHQSWGASA